MPARSPPPRPATRRRGAATGAMGGPTLAMRRHAMTCGLQPLPTTGTTGTSGCPCRPSPQPVQHQAAPGAAPRLQGVAEQAATLRPRMRQRRPSRRRRRLLRSLGRPRAEARPPARQALAASPSVAARTGGDAERQMRPPGWGPGLSSANEILCLGLAMRRALDMHANVAVFVPSGCRITVSMQHGFVVLRGRFHREWPSQCAHRGHECLRRGWLIQEAP
mmetsp:Transcript_21754/g.55463  ORF Transcript_21754/g.55463 Transcript_21754/m.55463 type:complete len:220 (+) Transcript_21754:724-1383(+)